MKTVSALLVAVFVVVSTIPAAAAAVPASTPDAESQVDTSERRLGDDVTTFVQSTAAETRGVVATEKWEASFERNGDKAAVERRIDRLEVELADLRQRRAALAAAAENDSISGPQYYGRLGQLDGELSALALSIDATEAAARQVDANTSRLATLRTETRETHANVAGPAGTTPPLGTAANRANNTGGSDGTTEPDDTANSLEFVHVSVESVGEDAETFDADGTEETSSGVSDADSTDGGSDPSSESHPERGLTTETTHSSGEAPGKEDVRGLRS
ncbi:hypothetical protein AUR64_17065 [Haloprofundus marisrubri]|uniref:Uncharacterized protein n=1 Tax=Haloprofundus marisrubri TaxID=1514971 RepID=A0A0W1R7R9_9EURY|nr:hypothetical protein [Haloprofundus marisrubri]KTG09483.1 hypothetical protein AUR64_17065 [Haloprofundus marisrubri]